MLGFASRNPTYDIAIPSLKNRDRDRDHYLWLEVGLQDNKYVYAPFIHIDIKDGKIWLQRNFTDVNLGEKLMAMGVKKEDIILGLHSPFMRQFSGYG